MADSCSAPGDSPPGGGASVSFCHIISHPQHAGFPGGAVRKNPPANAGNARDVDSLPGSGRSPGGGKGNPPRILVWRIHGQRGAWRATVQGVPESQTQLRLSTRVCPTQGHSAGSRSKCTISCLSVGGRDGSPALYWLWWNWTVCRSLTPTSGPLLRGWGGGL